MLNLIRNSMVMAFLASASILLGSDQDADVDSGNNLCLKLQVQDCHQSVEVYYDLLTSQSGNQEGDDHEGSLLYAYGWAECDTAVTEDSDNSTCTWEWNNVGIGYAPNAQGESYSMRSEMTEEPNACDAMINQAVRYTLNPERQVVDSAVVDLEDSEEEDANPCNCQEGGACSCEDCQCGAEDCQDPCGCGDSCESDGQAADCCGCQDGGACTCEDCHCGEECGPCEDTSCDDCETADDEGNSECCDGDDCSEDCGCGDDESECCDEDDYSEDCGCCDAEDCEEDAVECEPIDCSESGEDCYFMDEMYDSEESECCEESECSDASFSDEGYESGDDSDYSDESDCSTDSSESCSSDSCDDCEEECECPDSSCDSCDEDPNLDVFEIIELLDDDANMAEFPEEKVQEAMALFDSLGPRSLHWQVMAKLPKEFNYDESVEISLDLALGEAYVETCCPMTFHAMPYNSMAIVYGEGTMELQANGSEDSEDAVPGLAQVYVEIQVDPEDGLFDCSWVQIRVTEPKAHEDSPTVEHRHVIGHDYF